MFSISNKNSKAAMTLVEIMVAMAIGSLVLLVLGSVTLYSARSFSSMANYSDINRMSRMAVDEMTRDIRQSRGLVSFTTSPTTNMLVFKNDAAGTDTFALIHDKAANILKQVVGENEKVLSSDCTYFEAQLFQRNPIPNTFDLVPTTEPAKCKVVQLDYSFARHTGPHLTNSESVQSMKIVIRKRPD